MPSAATIIIGREILTGKFADENGPFFIEQLRALGVDLQRLVTLDDDLEAIAEEVRRCSRSYDYVFTTGGVGPTHDDVTLEAIARAFGRKLVVAEPLLALMRRYKIEPNEANLRMAQVPEGSVLTESEQDGFPLVRCENVWILPGVPKLVRKKFRSIAPLLKGQKLYTQRLFLQVHETDISQELTQIAGEHPGVDIGSYPRFDGGPKLILTLESASEELLAAAEVDLVRRLPVDAPPSLLEARIILDPQ